MSFPLTGLPDFKRMSRKALEKFRRDAREAHEVPCDANNYFTKVFNMTPWPQPRMWQSCAIAKFWCDYHGPCGHTANDCQTYYDNIQEQNAQTVSETPAPTSPPRVQLPKVSKPSKPTKKPKVDYRAMILEERQVRFPLFFSFGTLH
jgi:hypothetical protein